MARSRSPEENSETAAFVKALYRAGGFSRWTEFAAQARIQAPQLSDWQRGVSGLDGGNMLALIQAAAARSGDDAASLALRLARESFADQLALAAGRLEALANAVGESVANQQAGLDKLDELLRRTGGLGFQLPDVQDAPTP